MALTDTPEPAETSDPDGLKAIIARVGSGDTEAFSAVVRTYEKRVTSFCTALLRDRIAVEEVTQETFIRAYRYLDSYDTDRPFYPWLARIAFRLTQTYFSKRRPEELPLTAELDRPAGTRDPLGDLIRDEQSRALWQQVCDLPAGERAAVVLFYRQELSVRQVAETLGVTPGTVKTFLFRARRHLQQRLTEQGLIGAKKGRGKNKSSDLEPSISCSVPADDPGSLNPQLKPGGQGSEVQGRDPVSREGGVASKATPPGLLPRINHISPKSERDLGTISIFQGPAGRKA